MKVLSIALLGVFVCFVVAAQVVSVSEAAYKYDYELHEQADASRLVWQIHPQGSKYISAQDKDYVKYLAAGKVPKLIAYVPPSAAELLARRRGVLRNMLTRTDVLVLPDVWAGLDATDQKTVGDFRKAVRECFGTANPIPDHAGVVAVLKKIKREE